jgi:hypothetical protein
MMGTHPALTARPRSGGRLPVVIAVVLAISASGALSRVGAPARAVPALALDGTTITIEGRTSLGDRGMNSALAVADQCAYVGSRADAAPLVVDISSPGSPLVVGQLTAHARSTPRELRSVAALREVVVMFYDIGGGPNGLDIYRWDGDCRTPTLAGHYDFGSRAPHEFYLWQDPARPSRVLLFVAMFGAGGDGIDVIDVADPSHPGHVGGWSVPAAYGHAPVHSIALAPDGRLAYVSLWTGGLVVADVSDFTAGRGQPTVRPQTPPSGVYRTSPGDVHSAVPLPGRSMVVTTDERYPAPYGQGCPFGSGHIVDVSNASAPHALSTLAVPENTPSTCSAAGSGTWTSHNPTLTAHLALVTWYSAGLEVFGLDDPAQPQRTSEFRPSGVNPALRDLQLGTTEAMTWSYPVIFKGLVYVVDINQGLLVLRYRGSHQDEVENLAFAEGNSNLTSGTSAPNGTPSASLSGSAPTSSPGAPGRAPGGAATPVGLSRAIVPAIAVAALLALAALAVGFVVWRRRRRGAP